MTKNDKLFLLHFITRTAMYVYPADLPNIESFVMGYEIGRKNKCHFYNSLKELLKTKYKMPYSNDGQRGQITRLSEKQSLSPVITFKRVALDIIGSDAPVGFDSKMQVFLRTKIVKIINEFDKVGHPFPWSNSRWKDDWLSFTVINSEWFKLLWTKKQWSIIKAINNEVLKGNLFKNKRSKLPSEAILKLKIKFESLKEHPESNKRAGK